MTASDAGTQPLATAEADHAVLQLFENRIVVKRSGVFGRDKGEEVFPFKEIERIDLKKPGILAGHIAFVSQNGNVPGAGQRGNVVVQKKHFESVAAFKAAAEVRIGAARPESEQVLMEMKGENGTVYLFPHKVVIRRRGLLNTLNMGSQGDKEIWLHSLSGVQIKEPKWTTGYIQFIVAGSPERRGGSWQSWEDENSVVLRQPHYPQAVTLKQEIERLMLEARSSPPPVTSPATVPSVADELAKLANLREQGVITEEQFVTLRDKLIAG